MSTLLALQQKKPEIMRSIVRHFMGLNAAPDLPPMSEELSQMGDDVVGQFVHGFLDTMERTLQGETNARQEFLTLVLPPLRDGGMPLSMVGSGLPAMFAIVAAHLGLAHATWVARYAQEYSEFFYKTWDAE
jgi:hypothetical protein